MRNGVLFTPLRILSIYQTSLGSPVRLAAPISSCSWPSTSQATSGCCATKRKGTPRPPEMPSAAAAAAAAVAAAVRAGSARSASCSAQAEGGGILKP